ncbi:MAG: LamG domain-containing protein [Rhodoferax sp.]
MAAARYWRLTGVAPRGIGADLSLSEIALYDGAARVDGGAAITCTTTPISGTLAALSDASTATVATFAAADVAAPGFALQWDFGVAQDLSEIRFTADAGGTDGEFVYGFAISSSDDSADWALGMTYQQTPYPGAGGTLTIPLGTDPYADSVALLLHGDGANGSTSIVDASPSPKTVTAVGNAQISTAKSKFGGSSIGFDGAGDYLRAPPSDAFRFGTGDFTLEMWVYLNAVGEYSFYDGCDLGGNGARSNAFTLQTDTGGHLRIFSQGGFSAATTNAVVAGAWTHIAMVRYGGNATFYVGGIAGGAFPYAADITVGGCVIGAYADASMGAWLNGYLDEVRITKGVARYTGDFTPPAAPFATLGGDPHLSGVVLLLHADGTDASTSIVDSSPTSKTLSVSGNARISTAQSKFGGSSLYFDGSGDRVQSPDHADFDFGSGDFTVEFWMCPDTVTGTRVLIDRGDYSNYTPWLISQDNAALGFTCCNATYNAWAVAFSSANLLVAGVWCHVAAVRAGSTFKLFHNGIEVGSATYAGSLGTKTMPLGIGRTANNYYHYAGYLDEIRITKGVARYLGNFVPPSAPFSTAPAYAAYTPDTAPRPALAAPDASFALFAPGAFGAALADTSPAIDREDGGLYRITGTVKEKATPANTPLRRKVQLFHQASARLVRETWSAASDGAYSFDGIRDQTYFIVAFDHTGTYRAVIADNQTPQAMPL